MTRKRPLNTDRFAARSLLIIVMAKLSPSHAHRLAPSWERKLLSNAPDHQCVRVLFALVSGHMLLLAAFLVYLKLNVLRSKQAGGDNTTEFGAVDTVLSLWILALLYGGGCGVYAAVTRSVSGAAQTLGCWAFATVVHTWYLLFGSQIARPQLHPSSSHLETPSTLLGSSVWTIALHVLTDILSSALLVFFAVLLRAHKRAGGDNAELQSLIGARSVRSLSSSETSELAHYV